MKRNQVWVIEEKWEGMWETALDIAGRPITFSSREEATKEMHRGIAITVFAKHSRVRCYIAKEQK
jgi:hypothetical protein